MSDSLKDFHCLVVDDAKPFLRMIEAMLKAIGVGKVSSASNGSEAMHFMANLPRPVDVVLCDLEMPGGNGLQLLKAVRMGQVRAARLDTCFIMITGSTEVEAVAAAGKLNAHGYILKPISPDKLKKTILKARERSFTVDTGRYAEVVVPESTD